MMMSPRRRATDRNPWYTLWVSLPLVDRRTGEWSLSRTMASAFAAATIRWMSDLRHDPVTWEVVALVTLMACVALAAAFGKAVFESVAVRIAGRGEPEKREA
jgi:hypothetical protein